MRRTLLALALVSGLAWTSLPALSQDALPTRLLQAGDLVHAGSFRLPDVPGDQGEDGFRYAHAAIAYNAANDSLFVVGHDWHQRVAEVSIPAFGSEAAILQPLNDPFDGRLRDINPRDVNSQKIGGMFVSGDKLIISAYSDYDAEHSARASHFVRSVDLSAEDSVQGPIRVGSLPVAFTAGYFAPVPAAWQAALGGPVLNGQCCLNIITRTSYGPAVSVLDPAGIVRLDDPARAFELLGYPESRQTLGPWDGNYSLERPFNGTTSIRGAVLPEGTATVLFFGGQGTGPFCYGNGEGCNDPERSDQGNHAYPYEAHVWAYDAHDLALVRAGRRRPWNPTPYTTFRLDGLRKSSVGGATVDPSTGRIFVTERNGDAEKPLVHVFRIAP